MFISSMLKGIAKRIIFILNFNVFKELFHFPKYENFKLFYSNLFNPELFDLLPVSY
jgi:hypothetical protein